VQNPPLAAKEQNRPAKTDSFCFYIFIGMQLIWVMIALFALVRGNPKRLASPYDPDRKTLNVFFESVQTELAEWMRAWRITRTFTL
jgi:hypothetical protein